MSNNEHDSQHEALRSWIHELDSKVSKLEKVINGNGREGIVQILTRMDEKVTWLIQGRREDRAQEDSLTTRELRRWAIIFMVIMGAMDLIVSVATKVL